MLKELMELIKAPILHQPYYLFNYLSSSVTANTANPRAR
jgi:hypothetical protein